MQVTEVISTAKDAITVKRVFAEPYEKIVGLVAIAYMLSRPRVTRARAKLRSRPAAPQLGASTGHPRPTQHVGDGHQPDDLLVRLGEHPLDRDRILGCADDLGDLHDSSSTVPVRWRALRLILRAARREGRGLKVPACAGWTPCDEAQDWLGQRVDGRRMCRI